MNVKSSIANTRRATFRRTALAVAIVAGVGMTGQVLAQATTGTIFGSAPTSDTVQVVGGTGFSRTVPVDSTGHYSVTVPVGNYTVNLLQNGAVVQSHSNVSPAAGAAATVDFVQPGQNAQKMSTVTVTANALPAIDVTSTTQNLTITSQQLAQLPLARNSGAIALLAPGTTYAAALLSTNTGPTGDPTVSFGGSSIVENAYYINGFDTSDPLSNTGGISLPYGSIAQQQTLTSGYGAMYGRSAGGVISQVGKSGTDQWHFGGQVLWQPAFAQDSSVNRYWNNPLSTSPGSMYGELQSYNRRDSSWETIYDAYVGGPLIKNTLYMFLSAEADKSQGQEMESVAAGQMYYYKNSDPKLYGKLDWNINSNNILSLTGIYNSEQGDPAEYYNYNSTTHTIGGFKALGMRTKNAFDIWIAKYTSYITDNLTMNLMIGKMDGKYYQNQPAFPGFNPNETYIYNGGLYQNPAYLKCPTCTINNANTNLYVNNPNHKSEVRNMRLDFDWKLGNHDIQFGIDNVTDIDNDDGQTVSGPGYMWEYGQTGSATTDVIGGAVGPATPCINDTVGCYVEKYVLTTSASVQVKQRAQYVQDTWQVTPNLLLNLGLRNDQFTNYNPAGEPYLRLTKPQWAPRLGFSWDVFGDSTMKVFGNVGRYYLAMPTAVALRVAGAPLYTEQFYDYTGINADGSPINPTLIANNLPGGIYYVNNENGQPVNAKVASAQNLKAEYQDQFVLGMQQQFKMLGQTWVYGVTGLVNRIGRAIDDTDAGGADAPNIIAAAEAEGIPASDLGTISQSVLINPGQVNTFVIPKASGAGYDYVKVSNAQLQMPQLKRKYYSLDMYLEHTFNGKWWGKIEYTFSRSYGDYEGPVQSNIGQAGSSESGTEQWDFPQIMSYSNGLLANDEKHQLRIYGSYQINPEWSVGATYRIASGTPISCLGFYGPNQSDPSGTDGQPGTYGSSYHWCNGRPTPTGSTGFTPWTHILNLQVDYRPAFAQHKLDFSLQVHNVFNEQNAVQYYSKYNQGNAPGPGQKAAYSSQYLLPVAFESPRYMQFAVSYDY